MSEFDHMLLAAPHASSAADGGKTLFTVACLQCTTCFCRLSSCHSETVLGVCTYYPQGLLMPLLGWLTIQPGWGSAPIQCSSRTNRALLSLTRTLCQHLALPLAHSPAVGVMHPLIIWWREACSAA